jgi:hypothetical protein
VDFPAALAVVLAAGFAAFAAGLIFALEAGLVLVEVFSSLTSSWVLSATAALDGAFPAFIFSGFSGVFFFLTVLAKGCNLQY